MRFEWVFEALDIYFVQKKYPVSQSIFLLLKPHWFHVKILCNYLARPDQTAWFVSVIIKSSWRSMGMISKYGS